MTQQTVIFLLISLSNGFFLALKPNPKSISTHFQTIWSLQFQIPNDLLSCSYLVCDRKKESWYQIYEWIREFWTRVFPFLLIAYFNMRIMITYKSTKRDRIQRLTSSQTKRGITEKSEQEERRLFFLLFAIIIVFFLCTIPAAPLTIFVADNRSQNLTFQVSFWKGDKGIFEGFFDRKCPTFC